MLLCEAGGLGKIAEKMPARSRKQRNGLVKIPGMRELAAKSVECERYGECKQSPKMQKAQPMLRGQRNFLLTFSLAILS
jgi:hypothetical protein